MIIPVILKRVLRCCRWALKHAGTNAVTEGPDAATRQLASYRMTALTLLRKFLCQAVCPDPDQKEKTDLPDWGWRSGLQPYLQNTDVSLYDCPAE
ncbi:hypothetical protein PsWM33_04176 [Pseudovibrio sp. WM33]|nr:hypothetical protein PsWM33_04176 [Pseudovibrio sp. WM33]